MNNYIKSNSFTLKHIKTWTITLNQTVSNNLRENLKFQCFPNFFIHIFIPINGSHLIITLSQPHKHIVFVYQTLSCLSDKWNIFIMFNNDLFININTLMPCDISNQEINETFCKNCEKLRNSYFDKKITSKREQSH